ncbi:YVTN family beta-propeller repeat-containing protein, partial [Bacillus sp. SRB3LM]|nr:YVTN family beta-propeller repeat-containing protein [Bacillus sp. SRB3LM]
IDGNINTIITTVGVGLFPYGVGVDSFTNQIYVTNNNSNNVSVIDGNTNTVIGTVEVGSSPYGIGVRP